MDHYTSGSRVSCLSQLRAVTTGEVLLDITKFPKSNGKNRERASSLVGLLAYKPLGLQAVGFKCHIHLSYIRIVRSKRETAAGYFHTASENGVFPASAR